MCRHLGEESLSPASTRLSWGRASAWGPSSLLSPWLALGRSINSVQLLAEVVIRNLGLEHQTLAKPRVLPKSVVRRGTCFLLSFPGEDSSLDLKEVTAVAHLGELICRDPLVQPHCLSSKRMGAQSRQLSP